MKLENNDLVKGSSGRFGDQLVYRQWAGRTIIARRPKKKSVPDTVKQIAVKERFLEGVFYAKEVLGDPARKAVYQQRASTAKSAYNLALSDYCKSPEIKVCDVSDSGQAGEVIRIRAIDDFRVDAVHVRIMSDADEILEQGLAIPSGNGVDWLYTSGSVNPGLQGSKIVATASDLAGNKTTYEVEL